MLSTFCNPFLPGYLASLEAFGLSDYVVLCDSRGLSDRQQRLIFERVGGWSVSDHFNFDITQDSWSTPFYFVESHNSPETVQLINSLACSFLLNAGTPRKLSTAVLESTKHGVLNIHPGQLPQYRGKNCPEWAVYYEEPVLLSAHIMEQEYDEGDVLDVVEVEWRSLPSYVEFRRQVYLQSFELAASASLALSRNSARILYNSKSSLQTFRIYDAMEEDAMSIVKGRFRNCTL